jgi:4-hydroxy-tetrahydrodipicolinate synthase
VGIALRKEVLRLRGAIRSGYVRPPGPALDDVTRAELRAILERAGLLETR